MIKYEKMFALLKEHGYNTTEIRKKHILSEDTLTSIRQGKGGLSHKSIDKLCNLLHCQPGDLMEYVSDEDSTEK